MTKYEKVEKKLGLRHGRGFHYDDYDVDLERAFEFLDKARTYIKEGK